MTEHTKLVVRHLPPNLPENIFWNTLDPWLQPISLPDGTVLPPKCTATFKSYVPGKVRKNKSKIDIASRAYIQFSTPDQVLEFHKGYANQAFRDSHGNLTFPKVEFAPYQNVAGPPKKIDNRIGTIETNRDYQAFLAALAAPPPEPNPEASKTDPGAEKNVQTQVTPLIEHLRNLRKVAQEAAASAKQQRHATASHSSGKSAPGARSTAAPTQIMKRVVATNPPASLSAQKHSDSSPATRDETHRILASSSKESKRTKQFPPQPISSSNHEITSATTAITSNNNLPKSRPIKPPKSKKEERGREGPPPKTEPPIQKSANTKNQQPKKILQPPKPPKPATDSAATRSTPQKSSFSKAKDSSQNRPPKIGGNSSTWKDEESEPDLNSHQHHNNNRGKGSNHPEREGPKRPGGRGGGGGAGRGGRGGKSTSINKSIHASSSHPQRQHDTTAPSFSNSSSNTHNNAQSQEQPNKSEPNKNETAAARRRLGMALAGITSKPDRINSSSSRRDTPSKS